MLAGEESVHQQYMNHFRHYDPLKPYLFRGNNQAIAGLDPVIFADNNHYYYDFMLPNKQRDITEIFIRQRKNIVAGVSLIRDTPFTHAERGRLRAALPLLEIVAQDLLRERLPQRPVLTLTAKELEIVNLVREGDSNKRIALKLGISLATVKTHLRNIFAKTNISSRTELVAGGFYTYG